MLTTRAARVFWQLTALAVGWVLVQGIAEATVASAFAWLSREVGEPVPMYPYTMLAGAMGGTWISLRLVEIPLGRTGPIGSSGSGVADRVGAGAGAWRLRSLALGSALGAVAIGLVALLLWVLGGLQFETVTPVYGAMSADSWGSLALRALVLLAPSALWEELVFRGHLFAVAMEAAGARAARLSSSMAFGAVHVMNPGASVRTTLIVMLAGWCLALLRERVGLPAAWLAHLAWNWIMAAVLHVAVSGVPFAVSGYRAVPTGPDWLSGGSWGPEGGVVAAIVLGGGALFGLRSVRVMNAGTTT